MMPTDPVQTCVSGQSAQPTGPTAELATLKKTRDAEVQAKQIRAHVAAKRFPDRVLGLYVYRAGDADGEKRKRKTANNPVTLARSVSRPLTSRVSPTSM